MNNYYCFKFEHSSLDPESILAFLADMPFDYFESDQMPLKAYVQEQMVTAEFREQLVEITTTTNILFTEELIPYQNWNIDWESQRQPVMVGDKIGILPYLGDETQIVDLPYIIKLDANMTFGTGDHPTTGMILEYMVEMKLSGLKVMDFGCGTGILGILAGMKKAKEIFFIDNDQASLQDTLFNIGLNSIKSKTHVGGLELLENSDHFDLIISNINTHTHIEMAKVYDEKLSNSGILVLSGFIKKDEQTMKDHLLLSNKLVRQIYNDDWVCWVLTKVN